MLVSELEISYRVKRILKEAGIITLQDLCSNTEVQLLKHPGFGRVSLSEVKGALKGVQVEWTLNHSVPD